MLIIKRWKAAITNYNIIIIVSWKVPTPRQIHTCACTEYQGVLSCKQCCKIVIISMTPKINTIICA